jgi:hypothetical protein
VIPRAGLDDVEKILEPTWTRTPTPRYCSPVSSRYTDYAVPAPKDDVLISYLLNNVAIQTYLVGTTSLIKETSTYSTPVIRYTH